jgi:hypothetical protein
VKARHLSLILGSVGFIGMYLGTLIPPPVSHVGIGFHEGWEIGVGGVVMVGALASPYLAYIWWVRRRWSVAVGVAAVMYVATVVIFDSVWNDNHSTAALGLFWFPIVLYPLAVAGRLIDGRPLPSEPPPFSGQNRWETR